MANAGHLKRTIVTQLPAVESADEHTIYMVAKNSGSGNNVYDEYFLVVTGQTDSQTKKFEKIGDSGRKFNKLCNQPKSGYSKTGSY